MYSKAVLSIGGFDPSGGAGVLADIKTINQLNVQGFGVSTAITFQNASEFSGLVWLTFDQIQQQIIPLMSTGYQIDVVKIGLIRDLQLLEKLLTFLHQQLPGIRVVWDPVLKASAGFDFHNQWNQGELLKVIDLLYCMTPNISEALQIQKICHTDLSGLPLNVICKGGDGDGEIVTDTLYMISGEVVTLDSQRISQKSLHGTGCVFASALAAGMAKGKKLPEAFKQAKEYVYQLLRKSETALGEHYLIEK